MGLLYHFISFNASISFYGTLENYNENCFGIDDSLFLKPEELYEN